MKHLELDPTPGYFYPKKYYSSYYLPTRWSNFTNNLTTAEATNKTNFMPNLNLPLLPINIPQQMNNFNPVANPLNNHQQQQVNNTFVEQQQQQARNQFGLTSQLPTGQDRDPNEKVRHGLDSEFFYLDKSKKENPLFILSAVTLSAALDSQVDSVSSNDSNRSDVVNSDEKGLFDLSDKFLAIIINSDEKELLRHLSDEFIDSINSDNKKELLYRSNVLSSKLKDSEKIYKCEFCNNKFSKRQTFRRHLIMHSELLVNSKYTW